MKNSRLDYTDFLENKRRVFVPSGITVETSEINPLLFDFQKDIVRWDRLPELVAKAGKH